MTEQNHIFEHMPQPVSKPDKLLYFLDECQSLNKDPIEYAKEKNIDLKNEYEITIRNMVHNKFKDKMTLGNWEMISKIDKVLNPECQGKEGCASSRMRPGYCNTGLCTKKILDKMSELENIK